MPDGTGIADLRPVVIGCGRLENLRALDMFERVVLLPAELSRRLDPPKGVLYVLPPMMTDDAGELPGVSIALPAAGLSTVTILDTESRSC